MKKIVLMATMFAASLAWSQRSTAAAGGNEVNVNAGFNASAAALGASYEMNDDQIGWGGYFFLQTEDDDAGIFQTLAIGGMAKVHVAKTSKFDAYIAPGFGIALISDIPDNSGKEDDKTVFGPSMKIGAQYYFSPTVKVGVERFMIANWFDDEAPGSAEYTTAVIGFEF